MPEAGGDPVTPEEVYCGGVAVGIPRWQGWARDAERRLDDLMRGRTVEFFRDFGETGAVEGASRKKYPRQEVSVDPDSGLLIKDTPGYALDLSGHMD